MKKRIEKMQIAVFLYRETFSVPSDFQNDRNGYTPAINGHTEQHDPEKRFENA